MKFLHFKHLSLKTVCSTNEFASLRFKTKILIKVQVFVLFFNRVELDANKKENNNNGYFSGWFSKSDSPKKQQSD